MNLIIWKLSNISKKKSICFHHQTYFPRKSIVYMKRQIQAAVTTKIEPESIHMTRRTTRIRKPTEVFEANKRQTRKRKQSTSDDGINTTVALRKKKAVPAPQPKTKTRKPRAKKIKGLSVFIFTI